MSKRKTYTADQKRSIVEEGNQPGVSKAEVCRRHGIAASVFYRWEEVMRQGALEALADSRGRQGRAIEAENARLKEQLARKNDVIAELTEALVQEKRGLSDYLRPSVSPRR